MDLATLDDRQLLDRQGALAAARRRLDAELAAVAAEIAHRSRRELGHEGLAQRLGARTAEKLVQQVALVSARDAGVMVRVGGLSGPVGAAVANGALSLEAADAIRSIATPALEEQLIADATELPPDRLAAHARRLRDDLDRDGVASREDELRERRYLHLVPQPDGMTRLSGLLDPESAAAVVAAVDAATSPRRGVRFVDPEERARDEALVAADRRTLEQVAADALVELVRIGTAAGSDEVLGAHRPSVRVHVTLADLDRRSGAGELEGQSGPVSIATVERIGCATGVVPILFDDAGQPLDVGRDQRLTARQRIALAARDGGCRFPGCDRPPSWCEAHHIEHWYRDEGRTDVADGVLLCRHHHLLVHNNGWHVARVGARYSVIPPRTIDPAQSPIEAPPKGALARRFAASA